MSTHEPKRANTNNIHTGEKAQQPQRTHAEINRLTIEAPKSNNKRAKTHHNQHNYQDDSPKALQEPKKRAATTNKTGW